MATLTVTAAARALNQITAAVAAVDGDEFVNTGKEIIMIDNTGIAVRTVTFATPVTVDGLAVAELALAIPAGEKHLLGPFPIGYYNDANAKVQMTYSSEADLELYLMSVA